MDDTQLEYHDALYQACSEMPDHIKHLVKIISNSISICIFVTVFIIAFISQRWFENKCWSEWCYFAYTIIAIAGIPAPFGLAILHHKYKTAIEIFYAKQYLKNGRWPKSRKPT